MQIAKNAEIIQPTLLREERLKRYMTIAGQSPKTAKSDKESSSAPNRLHELNSRAKRPSVASKNAAITTDMTAYSQFDTSANLTCIIPTTSAERVARLGIIFPIGKFLKILCRFFFIPLHYSLCGYRTDFTIGATYSTKIFLPVQDVVS